MGSRERPATPRPHPQLLNARRLAARSNDRTASLFLRAILPAQSTSPHLATSLAKRPAATRQGASGAAARRRAAAAIGPPSSGKATPSQPQDRHPARDISDTHLGDPGPSPRWMRPRCRRPPFPDTERDRSLGAQVCTISLGAERGQAGR
eukprot:278768-Pyramimonas_sp.AAC.1